MRSLACQKLESELTNARIRTTTLSVQASQSASEMTDLIKAKTELECVIEDAVSAGQDGEARRHANERELEEVEQRMNAIRTELMELDPQLEDLIADERERRKR